MKQISLLGGDEFNKVAFKAYDDVLTGRENSVRFRFNGVEVIMFNDV